MPEMKSLTLNDKTYDCFVDSVARTMATWSAVTDNVAGESAVMSDASNYNFIGLRVFGKTTQNGTPTPDAPVELVSVGDNGNITVNVNGLDDSQNLTLLTPNGLPGIPVASGGNYTDANGQQWICDEIDLARGVYVQRIALVSKPITGYRLQSSSVQNGLFQVLDFEVKSLSPIMSNMFIAGETRTVNYTISTDRGGNDFPHFYYREYTTVDELKSAKGDNTLTIVYVLATPVEIPLSEEELAAYADLHTYKDYTTVSNDTGAWMDVEYVMDAKKYINSLVTGGIAPARVE